MPATDTSPLLGRKNSQSSSMRSRTMPIFLLDPDGRHPLVEPRRGADHGVRRGRGRRPALLDFLRSRGPCSTRSRSRELETARAKAASKTKGGAFAKTARASGRIPSSPSLRNEQRRDRAASRKVTRDMTERRQAEEELRQSDGDLPAARLLGPRLRDLHARSRTATSPPGTPARSGSKATSRRRSSAATSRVSIREEDMRQRQAGARAGDRARAGQRRRRRVAPAQRRHALLGERRHHRGLRRSTASCAASRK